MELMSLILPCEIYYRNTFHDSACGCAKNLKGVKKGKYFPSEGKEKGLLSPGKLHDKSVRFLQKVLYFSMKCLILFLTVVHSIVKHSSVSVQFISLIQSECISCPCFCDEYLIINSDVQATFPVLTLQTMLKNPSSC